MKLVASSILILIASIIFYFYKTGKLSGIFQKINKNQDSSLNEFTYCPFALKLWHKNDNLGTMKRVFDTLGWKRVENLNSSW
jgi:hypothetical protein